MAAIDQKPSALSVFSKGLLIENPTLRQMLGLCPTLAVTTAVTNGIGMGVATTFVLVCSGIVVSLLRNIIPTTMRLPAFITVIAGFFFFQAEDGIRDFCLSRGLGDVYKRQSQKRSIWSIIFFRCTKNYIQ